MELFLNILFLLIGFALLVFGADLFVTEASVVAKKLKVPSFIIGITIVAIGTSLPEFAVGITNAIRGTVSISVGNIVGADMFDMLVIVGAVSLISPVSISKSFKKLDLPVMLATITALTIFSADSIIDNTKSNIISRTESILFIVLLAVYITISILNAKKERLEMLLINPDSMTKKDSVEQKEEIKELPLWRIILYIVLGLGAVIFGAECVSKTSQFIATKAGMSETLVGLTVVSFGTTLPELTTSIIAAKKGDNNLALGNIVGSVIVNILLILGTVGLIGQIPVSNETLLNMAILFAYSIIFTIICLNLDKVTKKYGIIFICMYLAYFAFAIIKNYCF